MQRGDLARYRREIATVLGAWSAVSVITGGTLALMGHRTGRKQWLRFGRQSALWGVVDGVIAGAGARASRDGDLTPEEVALEATKLRVTLLLNVVADVGYVAVGAHVASRAKPGPPETTSLRLGRGDGWAILLQGTFLFAFDAVYALRLSRALSRVES